MGTPIFLRGGGHIGSRCFGAFIYSHIEGHAHLTLEEMMTIYG